VSLASQLSALESSGLIQLHGAGPDLEYIFRHILIQEAAYDSLLKSDQRQLHRAVGEVLERLYPERRAELAGQLAVHFSEAGEAARAAAYFILAGDRAGRGFANQEAISYYTRALAHLPADSPQRVQVLRDRARLYDIIGEFELAKQDLETALQEASSSGHVKDEWLVLQDLGLLWSARDYGQTGEYYQRALRLAHHLKTKESLAYSLNRIGNWYVNAEQADEGLESHQKALAIFEELSDKKGISETLDYLGMSVSMRGEFAPGQDYLERAMKLFEELDDRRGYVSSATSYSLQVANYQGEVFVVGDFTLAMAAAAARQAVSLARQIGARSAEMWALCCQALNEWAMGEFDSALKALQRNIEIGLEIEHQQWLVMVHSTLGVVNYDLEALPRAAQVLETGLEMARTLKSEHWAHVLGGVLASVYLAQDKIDQAEALLDSVMGLDDPMQTMGQRQVWCSRVDLALKRGQPQAAFDILQRMKACTYGYTPETPILRLDLLEGQALCQLADFLHGEDRLRVQKEAEKAFHKAQRVAEQQGARARTWRIHKALARLYRRMGRDEDADNEMGQAQSIVNSLAENIAEKELREGFLKNAMN
jgi:tetratricopeptide (TPR) repeat protein